MRSVKVSDFMAKRLVTLHPQTNVVEAMSVLLDKKISGAPVVDDSGALVGVLSEVDLMKIIIQDSYYDEAAGVVGDFMRFPVDTVDAARRRPLEPASALLKNGRPRRKAGSNPWA